MMVIGSKGGGVVLTGFVSISLGLRKLGENRQDMHS